MPRTASSLLISRSAGTIDVWTPSRSKSASETVANSDGVSGAVSAGFGCPLSVP
jgi:hypothetical protein